MGSFFKRSEEGGEPGQRDPSSILAYMEELERLRAPVHMSPANNEKVSLAIRIVRVDEQKGLGLVLSRGTAAPLSAGQEMLLAFTMDGMRFVAPLTITVPPSDGKGEATLPQVVYHAERRAKMRARFGPREKAVVTVLEGLFEGTGATGRLVDLSMEGLCMQIERAMSIQLSRPVSIQSRLFQPGLILPIVRIQQIVSTPTLECSGRVAHIEDTTLGVTLGIHFEGLNPREVAILNQVMGRRLPTFSRSFPVRRRRQEILDEAMGDAPAQAAAAAQAPAQAAAAAQAAAREAAPVPVPTPDPEPDAALSVPAQDRALMVAKRTKRILLIMFDDLDRSVMAGTLQVDGYHKVMEARNYMEALGICRTMMPNLIIIDQTLGVHSAQEFLDRLRKAADCSHVPVVLLSEAPDVRTTLMARAARIHRVQKKPVNFDGEFRQVLLDLLQLESGR
jgi:CheY-like chemotaxis protein